MNTPPRSQPAETIERRTTLKLAHRPIVRIAAGVVVLAVAAAVLLLSAGNVGYASDTPVKRGDLCTQLGQERKDRSGDVYICTQKPGDSCPRFHAKHPGHGGAPLPPCVCPSKSPSTSPSPSKSPSVSASPSKPATVSPSPSKPASPKPSTTTAQPSTTPVGQTLPVTGGTPWLWLAGVAMTCGGAGFVLLGRYRRNRSA